ncbi:23S rRNA (adenine(2503)-C(2))-methyltransferase RlmN [Rubripirellula amarantea]|uniref:23S rRNA (adenine(2503)-C(2))-methyltransferase RlmN n=1 Tax=Rubripirellula amarantea TaxID=2527999 RepID=UPI001F5F97CE|nr:23S rRNA (adenine(2503)-C(2))-methyltransferase RlmN [Rubripirellula amarantea]
MNLPVIETKLPPNVELDDRAHLLDLTVDQLKVWLSENGHPGFRAKQIIHWVYQQRVSDFSLMSNLPKALRESLDQSFRIWTASEAALQTSADGTEKLLIRLADGGEVECVLLRDGTRRSICVSSQVGCAMGCVFCASGLDGVDRNLTTGEILEQMLRLQARLEEGERLSHIVMMGMGEPLANLDRVLGALSVARSEDGLGISPRRITISTVGLPPAMDRLAKSGVPYNLAVSLHAPNDELRNQLVPVNHKIGVQAVLDAADRYFEANGRRLTFEYVLLGGVNDSADDARQLVRLLKQRTVMLNVIPYNPVEGLPYQTPSRGAISDFRQTLEHGGVNVQFRERKGGEIDAACGQLRRNRQKPNLNS